MDKKEGDICLCKHEIEFKGMNSKEDKAYLNYQCVKCGDKFTKERVFKSLKNESKE